MATRHPSPLRANGKIRCSTRSMFYRDRRKLARSASAVVALGAFSIFAMMPQTILMAGSLHGGIADDRTIRVSLDAGTTDYKLGPRDKIRVMVHEWRPAKDEIFAWTAINAEYTVGPSGRVSLPLVGEIYALDKTTTDLAAVIAGRLKHGMGLATAPDTSVSIVEFRPIYVVGDVEKAGEFEYRPGLTVLKALGLGGGLYRGSHADLRLERDVVTSRGDIDRILHEKYALMVRRARLETELNRGDKVECPTELLRGEDLAQCASPLIAQEQRILIARLKAFESQLRTLNNLKDYLTREAKTVAQQKESHEKQVSFVKQELEGVRHLNRKGLATSPRRLSLERNLAELEGSGLRFDRDLMRIRQEISKTEISIAELNDKREGELTSELQGIEIKLGQLEVQMLTAQGLLNEALVIAPAALRARLGGKSNLEPHYTIVRMRGGIAVELTASEATMLQPGDTLKVKMGGDEAAISPRNTESISGLGLDGDGDLYGETRRALAANARKSE